MSTSPNPIIDTICSDRELDPEWVAEYSSTTILQEEQKQEDKKNYGLYIENKYELLYKLQYTELKLFKYTNTHDWFLKLDHDLLSYYFGSLITKIHSHALITDQTQIILHNTKKRIEQKHPVTEQFTGLSIETIGSDRKINTSNSKTSDYNHQLMQLILKPFIKEKKLFFNVIYLEIKNKGSKQESIIDTLIKNVNMVQIIEI